jgi:Family of unknown function (DUF5684)
MMIPVLAQLGSDDAARSAAAAAASMTTSLFILAVVLLVVVSTWKVFERAGEPGWASLVPIYNLIVLCRVAGVSGWWVLAAFIPLLNIIFLFVTSVGVANRFGKGAGYGIGLALLPFIFWPMLAFGDSAPVARTA